MSWLHADVLVESVLQFVKIWLIAHARTATQAASETTNTTAVESISGSSTAPSLYRSTSFPALVPLARVQKLQA